MLASLRQAPCSGLVNAARRKPGSICGVERDSDSEASEDDLEPDELHAATSPTKSRGARRTTALVDLCCQVTVGHQSAHRTSLRPMPRCPSRGSDGERVDRPRPGGCTWVAAGAAGRGCSRLGRDQKCPRGTLPRMPFVVGPFDDARGYATFDTLEEAEAAAQAQSTKLRGANDGQEVRVLPALPPQRPGGRPRPVPEPARTLAIYLDGRRIG